jgi:DNA-binding response OmpR family regulator
MNDLTKLQRACFAYLAANTGRYVDRGELLREVWHCSPGLITRRVDQAIASIRKALGYDVIESSRAGYKLVRNA